MITGLPAIVFSPPLMCDDIHATLAELRDKGADVAGDVSDQGWGLLAAVRRARRRPGRRAGWGHRAGPGRRRP